MEDSLGQLAESASVTDFLPLIAYRFTRERLRSAAQHEAPTETRS